MFDVLGQFGRMIEFVHLAVDAYAGEALRAQFVEQVVLLSLAGGHHRGEDHQARILGQCEDVVHHLRYRLGAQGLVMLRAERRTDACEQQPQVVVDLGDRTHCRARVVAGSLLLDRDRRRQALDEVDVGLFHQLQELACVGRQRLDVAALAFGVQGVERKR